MNLTSPVQDISPLYPESDGKPMAETDVHRQLLSDLVFTLETFFQKQPDVYVSGNLLIYYVEGNPKKRIAPDVFVARGIKKRRRRIYKLWEEGVAPQVVIELTSRQTWREDLQEKWRLYEQLGVEEYFIFDPEYDYLDDPLVGYRLKDGKYKIMNARDRRLRSKVLGLELVDTGETLRLFDPGSGRFLPNMEESANAQQRLSELESELARHRERFGVIEK
ncbi:MAG TPA: Uma2 family endonuclease [Blastocatellia bacterium]